MEPAPKVEPDLYKRVDADYYGYRDEEDGELVDYEKQKSAEGGLFSIYQLQTRLLM